jgi:hypothetical protein
MIAGAKARANLGHIGGGPQHGGGFQEPAFCSELHPFGNGVAERTAADATWVRAEDAAAGLLASGGFVPEAIDFEEVGGSL